MLTQNLNKHTVFWNNGHWINARFNSNKLLLPQFLYLDKLWVSKCWSNEHNSIVQVCKAVGYWSLK